VSSNDEVERRGASLTPNGTDLSRSSTPSLAHRRRDPRSLEPIVRRIYAIRQGSAARRLSMTTQYSPCHDLCHLQPLIVPGAFASMKEVDASADSATWQLGHRGDAVARKAPPHPQGANNNSASIFTGPWTLRCAPGGISRYQQLSNAVRPHLSQYAYAVSPKPLCNSSYWNWLAHESQLPTSIFSTAVAPN
jgi:hypothetical protein